MKKIILLIASVMLALLVIEEKGLLNVHALPDTSSVNEITEVAHAKKSILGTAFTPANIPRSTPKDVENFFNLAALIGSNVILIPDWAEDMKIDNIRTVMAMAHAKGMKFHVQLSPISLYGGRKTPSIPKIVTGKSFGQQTVRQAFKTKILELAALKPDLLGLGTEVNFLVQDPSEFKHYVSLTKEAYDAVKYKYPDQTVTISFQWDVLLIKKQFDIIFSYLLPINFVASYMLWGIFITTKNTNN